MQSRSKPVGIKQKIREEKKKGQRLGLVVAVAILILIVFISGFVVNYVLNQPLTSQFVNSGSQLKAAIVDQLSLTFPNQTFVETAMNILKRANYTVDYFGDGKITVEFYRNLPSYCYRLIILRVHSGIITSEAEELVTFFTTEHYDRSKYVFEQLTRQVAEVMHYAGEATHYFGINQRFVIQSMKGTFQNTTIIMMGCQGLPTQSVAESFTSKGARVYVGWNGSVLASHTDQATTCLLQHLIDGKETIRQAIANTTKEVGPDPESKGMLNYYPLEAGDQTIKNTNDKD